MESSADRALAHRPRRRSSGRAAGPPDPAPPDGDGQPATLTPAGETRPPDRDSAGSNSGVHVTAAPKSEPAAAVWPAEPGPPPAGEVQRRRRRGQRDTPEVGHPTGQAYTGSGDATTRTDRGSDPVNPVRGAGGGRSPVAGRPERRRGDSAMDRSLRALVSIRTTQLPPTVALRAREFANPSPADLAEAERSLVLVRRFYVPPTPLTTGSGSGTSPGTSTGTSPGTPTGASTGRRSAGGAGTNPGEQANGEPRSGGGTGGGAGARKNGAASPRSGREHATGRGSGPDRADRPTGGRRGSRNGEPPRS